MNTGGKKTKVLIIHDMPLQTYRVYDYNELADRGYEVTGGYFYDQERKMPVELKFKPLPLYRKKILKFTYLTNFKDVNPDDYDVVIVAPNFWVLNFFKLYRKKYRNKVILWGHMKGHDHNSRIAGWYRDYLFKNYRSLVFYESKTRDEFIKKGYKKENLFVANNTQFVDNKNIDLDKERQDFVYVGRIQDRKRDDVALKAYKKVKEKSNDPNLRFLVVGGGNSDALKELVEKEQIKDVVFTGAIYDENELHKIFSTAIAYVSPGHVGLGVLQAIGHGVPVITCEGQPHAPEVINCNEENSIMPPMTVEAVEAAMWKLYSDKALQKKMSKAAYDYYNENCTIEIMIDGIEAAIKHLLKFNQDK